MPPINFINNSWQKSFEDTDFLDRKKLVGEVYHRMVMGMMQKTPDERHATAVDIVLMVANGMYPACTVCGKKCQDTRCRNCKIQQNGILGIIS